jgi:hypothetical protein
MSKPENNPENTPENNPENNPVSKPLISVLCKRNIWVAAPEGSKKVVAGTIIELSKEQIKVFGSAVTKDIDED